MKLRVLHEVILSENVESDEGMSAVSCLTDIIWIVSLLLALTLDRIRYLKVDTCVKCISQNGNRVMEFGGSFISMMTNMY